MAIVGGVASCAIVTVFVCVAGAAVPSSAFAVNVTVWPSSAGSRAIATLNVWLALAAFVVNVCVDAVPLPIWLVSDSVLTATSSAALMAAESVAPMYTGGAGVTSNAVIDGA